MPPRSRKPPQEFIADITVPPDAVSPVREAHDFSRNKLGILSAYLRPYVKACKSAGGCTFVDGLAGPGLYHIRETNEFLLGSTPIALRVDPPFTRCVALEYSRANYDALVARTSNFSNRLTIALGDCNRDLVPLIEKAIPVADRWQPVFCLLDPEGFELHWRTVVQIARVRRGPKKPELLILVNSPSIPRLLPVSGSLELHNEMNLNTFLPPDSGWRATWESRLAGEITPGHAIEQYLESYRVGLHADIGYKHVLVRDIRDMSGHLMYHLVFATDDDTGKTIMTDVFDRMEPNRDQLRLF